MLPLKNAGNIDVQLKLKASLTFTCLIRSGVRVSFCDIWGSDSGTVICWSFTCFCPFSISTYSCSLTLFLLFCLPLFSAPSSSLLLLPFPFIVSRPCLQHTDAEGSFSVTPDELSLRVGEEQGIVVSFKPQGSRKYRERYTNLVFYSRIG